VKHRVFLKRSTTTLLVGCSAVSGFGLEIVYAITVRLCRVHIHMKLNVLDLGLCNTKSDREGMLFTITL
jgi:hypothetical protein